VAEDPDSVDPIVLAVDFLAHNKRSRFFQIRPLRDERKVFEDEFRRRGCQVEIDGSGLMTVRSSRPFGQLLSSQERESYRKETIKGVLVLAGFLSLPLIVVVAGLVTRAGPYFIWYAFLTACFAVGGRKTSKKRERWIMTSFALLFATIAILSFGVLER